MVYHCRLCGRTYRYVKDVIGIFTEEGKSLAVAQKILYSLSILVTQNDPTSKYVCKECWSHVEVNVTFASSCHETNEQLVNNFINNSTNSQFKEEMLKFFKIPVHLLIRRYANINHVYSSIVYHLKHKPGLLDTDAYVHNFLRYLRNSFTNGGCNENNAAIANGMSPTPLVNGDTHSNKTNITLKALRNKLKRKFDFADKTCTNTNGHEIASRTINDHDYDIQSMTNPTVNGEVNVFNEVICLDDDEDSDKNQKSIENNVHGVNRWVNNTVVNSESTSNVSNGHPKTYTETFVPKELLPLPVIEQHFSLASSSTSSKNSVGETDAQNSPLRCTSRSSNVSTEEISVTPDIGPLNIDRPIALVPEKSRYYYIVSKTFPINPPPLVSPDTGFHFLSSLCANEPPTVDLTHSDEPTVKPKSLRNKRRNIKTHKSGPPNKKNCPQMSSNNISKTETQRSSVKKVTNKETIPTLRPKRASAASVDDEIKKSNSYKLGNQADTAGWKVPISNLVASNHQCPICLKYFTSTEHRRLHETNNHLKLPESDDLSVDSDSPLDETYNQEKLEFLNYLNLGRMSAKGQVSNQMNIVSQLAKRKNVLNAIKTYGMAIGSYKCPVCKYETSRMFILWAHMSINHNTKSDCDSRTNSFCFICERVLPKRSQLLKHIDKCLIKQHESKAKDSEKIDCAPSTSSVKKYVCEYCKADNFDSLVVLEQHLWDHFT